MLWLWLIPVVGMLFWRYLLVGQLPLLPTNDSETTISARTMAMRSLFDGEFPLWNPYILGGAPFFGDYPTSLLSPFNLPYLALGLLDAYAVRMVLEFLFAGLGAYLFLRRFLAVSAKAALFGGIVFMLNGYFFWRIMLPTFLSTTAFLPLMFYYYAKALEEDSWRCAVAAGLIVTLMVFASYWILPYIVLVFPVYHAAAVIADWRRRGLRGSIVTLKHLAVAAIVAIGLTAIQLLPAVELAMNTARRQYHYPAPGMKGLGFLLMGAFDADGWPCFGAVPDTLGWGREGMKLCIGLAPFLLALIGIFQRGDRKRVPLLATGLFFMSLYLASILPGLHDLAVKLAPSFDTMQHSYSNVIYTFMMSVMAAVGFDHLLGGRAQGASAPIRIVRIAACFFAAVMAVFLVGTAVLVVFRGALPDAMAQKYIAHGKAAGTLVHADAFYAEKLKYLYSEVLASAPCMMISFAAKLAGLCVLLRWLRRMQDRPFPARRLILLPAVGLLAVGWQYIPYNDRADFYPKNEVVHFLQEHDPDTYRMLMRVNPVREPMPEGEVRLDHFSEITDWARVNTRHLFRSAPMHFGIRKVDGLAGLCLKRFYDYTRLVDPAHVYEAQVTLAATKSPLLDLLNTRYVVCTRPQRADHLNLVCEGAGMYVFETRTALPRAFCAARARSLPDEEEMLRQLSAPDFDPTEAVLLETPVDAGEEPGELRWATTITKSKLNSVEVEVEASIPCWLVLCDTYYPGWKASVNGEETPVLPAYHALRAVRVPKGRSTVGFAYAPRSFAVGLWITTGSLCVLIPVVVALTVFESHRKRQ